ncbi:MAG: RsmE family RNA methyltransferase [Candidatus Zixiibacteriota bacterium]
MPFYFAEIMNIVDDRIAIVGSEHRHLTKVMRLKKGARVTVTDGAGMVYDCFLTKRGRERSELQVITSRRNVGEPQRAVTVAVGLSAVSKFDLLLQMCVEIGVSGFAPLLSHKSRIKLGDNSRIERKLRRWREIIKAERSRLPEISAPQAFESYVRRLEGNPLERIIAHPSAGEMQSARAQAILGATKQPLVLLVGPEAGFTPEEFEQALRCGFEPLSLGDRILRAETAAPALASLALLGAV